MVVKGEMRNNGIKKISQNTTITILNGIKHANIPYAIAKYNANPGLIIKAIKSKPKVMKAVGIKKKVTK